ncbi:hypothetical protein Y032_0155g3068 [Ancylostoma ceylanicum]|uniref:Splicing factor Cactin n=1 Tax=Ancylostoma ceylanicum TaxID=53326 RepID=A0A016SZR5_9BILA|nr:hypothetical protein Y032_0155g3068 [Ancylostoma ceylanicum]
MSSVIFRLKEAKDLVNGKSVDELCQLERTIVNKVNAGGSGTDISYWEGLLVHLKVHIAKTRLKELHQKMLKLKLARIREEQMREVGKVDSQGHVTIKKRPISDDEGDDLEKQVRKKIDLDELESTELDDEQKEMRWRQLSPEQLEVATLQLYERGGYSPSYGDVNDTMPGIEVLDEKSDVEDLLKRRREHRKQPAGVSKIEADMLAIARKGMEGDESTFSVEQPLETQSHLWSDKYRPRKPTYLNRVQTGFDWNKYNQTHYDMDNPPPKIVQGYKFNIFYPDLLDPSETPSFTVTPCDDPDFAVIRFKAGPPYEDIAFKCVNHGLAKLCIYSELQTAVGKGRDRGAAFLGRDTGDLHARSRCLFLPVADNSSTTSQQVTGASMQSTRVSAQERRMRYRPLSTSVRSLL